MVSRIPVCALPGSRKTGRKLSVKTRQTKASKFKAGKALKDLVKK